MKKVKWCWVAKEGWKKNLGDGWRLYLSLGHYDLPLKGFFINDRKQIEKFTKGNIVYVHKEVKHD